MNALFEEAIHKLGGFAAFRLFLALPFLGKLEQVIEARRMKKWLRNIV